MAGVSNRKDVPRSLILAMCVGLSVLLHVGIVLVAPDEPPKPAPRPRREIVKPVPITVRRDLIKQLEKLPEPEQKKPEPEKMPPEPKKPDVKKPEPPKKEPPKPVQPKPEPQPAPPKAVDAKPVDVKPAEPSKPKPFVLKNVALKGGVAVQTGEDSNLFGDPSRDAKGFKKGIDAPMAPGDTGDSAGGGGTGTEKEQVVIKQPKALNDVKGEYPAAFRDLRRVVRVELLITIGQDGNVKAVKVRKGAETEFNDAAIRAVNQLRFEPATRNGVPISFNLKWTVVFIPEGT